MTEGCVEVHEQGLTLRYASVSQPGWPEPCNREAHGIGSIAAHSGSSVVFGVFDGVGRPVERRREVAKPVRAKAETRQTEHL